jgi:hypothetical protein
MIFGDCGLPALRRLGEGGRIGRKKAQKAQRGQPQPKPHQENNSRRDAEDAERILKFNPFSWSFSALSATLRGKIFAEMTDFFIQWYGFHG